jgi:hypothetical protein
VETYLPCCKCKRQYFFFGLITIAVIILFSGPEKTKAAENNFPFQPGEQLIFRLKWSIIPAGKAFLEVCPIETIKGVPAYHFSLTIETNAFIDTFYKVRDRIDAYADIAMQRSMLYKKKQREGKTQRDVVVNFDWLKNEAQYYTPTHQREPISILPGTFDPLSVFYYARLMEPKEHKKIARPVSDGKKCIVGKGTYIEKEKIKVPCGKYDVYRFEPDLEHIGGVFEKSKNAKIEIWITADNRRMPVKIRSKVVVGSFVGELVSCAGLKKDS